MTIESRGDTPEERLWSENESLRRAVTELTVLNDISREIGALTDLEEVLRRIVERSVAAVHADEGVITLVDSEARDSRRTLVRSMATRADRQPFHLNEQIVGWMLLHRQPLCIDRSEVSPFLGPSEQDVRAFLSVPLLARGHLIGVLTVCNPLEGPSFDDADKRLLTIIGSQSAQIIENARLYEEEKALRRVEDDLRMAFEIQSRLLPAGAPAVEGYDLAGVTIPAQQVGGDFYDFIPMSGDRLAVCVGDVSGKGLPAALLMASAQATIRGQVFEERSPAETVARSNAHIYRSVRRGNFLTLFYSELDPLRHRLRFVNAGHNRPILLHGGEETLLRTGGVAIGLLPDFTFAEGEVSLEKGDVLAIYSDGLTEASAEGEEFGDRRMIDVLRRNVALPADQIARRLLEVVQIHAGASESRDDMTLVIIARR